jgi:hypothetical protein
MGSSTKQAKSTSSSSPWTEQQPYLKEQFSEAQKLYKGASPQYFPSSTVAGFSPEQQQAQQMGTDRATQGNASMGMSQGYNNDVLQGKYLNSNPYQDSVFQNIQSKVLPSVNSQFMGSGRTGSNMQGDTLTRALTESYAPYASQNYQYGLGQMDAAANRSQMYADEDWRNIQGLQDIGTQKQGQAQNELQDAVNRHNYYQDLPANRLAQYAGFTGGNYGGTTTSSTPYQSPSIWSQLGGAALGLGGLLL